MNRIILFRKKLYVDIIKQLMILLISIPLWLSFDVTAKMVNEKYIDYEELNDAKFSFEVCSDDYALNNIETKDIIIYNDTDIEDEYKLLLKVSPNINTKNIKININFDVNTLNNFRSYEENNYKYIILDEGYLENSSQKYIISMWQVKEGNRPDYEFIVM